MIAMVKRHVTTDRLAELEQTVDLLNGQLREVQWELHQAKSHSLTERVWKNWRRNQSREFMSAVCNRHIRPNTKVA